MSVALDMSVVLEESTAETVAVGEALNLRAIVSEADPGEIWIRYRVREPIADTFRIVRDYSPEISLVWAPTRFEGQYEVEISARNVNTGETVSTLQTIDVTTRVTGGQPVITPTANELVFLYSAPPCAPGSRMHVTFTASDGFRQSTNSLDCVESRSLNVYLAGLRADTEYTVQHTITNDDGQTTAGPSLNLKTQPLSLTPPPTRALRKPTGIIPDPILLQSRLFDVPIATDLDGNVVWYVRERVPYLVRPQPGGYFFALLEDSFASPSRQRLRLIDLAGNTVLETNAARVNEQLQAMGRRPMTSFHHDATRLPDGRILALVANEQIMENVQGPGAVDVLGDMIILFNEDLEVQWVWDAFDHLDVTRRALMDEKCTLGAGGCPVFRLAEVSNDWLHGNSIAVTPDGHIVYSARHQDWIIKIDFANGTGSGRTIWRLGQGGDFQFLAGGPNPWFSHQHDATFVGGGQSNRLLLFDNNNARNVGGDSANSRGQLLEINEADRTVKFLLNADLGAYAFALGSAQQLSNGNYHFGLGWTPDARSQSLEYDASGRLVTQMESATQQYRSLRMRDLYTP
jgi:hypothetical protein